MAKYFQLSEFQCKCCGALPPQGIDGKMLKLLEVLDSIRDSIGEPIIITSGYRCPSHNAAVGGVSNSLHVAGCAADIICPSVGVNDGVKLLGNIARRFGANGVGYYYKQGFVHVDIRDYNTEWSD